MFKNKLNEAYEAILLYVCLSVYLPQSDGRS
jgi:hypothetical protein